MSETKEPDLEEATRDTIAWLERHLQSPIHVPVFDDKGRQVNSFSAIRIPEWEVRQKLSWLKEITEKAT